MRDETADALGRLFAQPIAHRGLHAGGAVGPVENSLSAARAAIAAGYAIECDVQLSRDGEAMVFHDTALDRLTGASGSIGELDGDALCELRLRGGPDHVPALAEFLAAIDGRTPLVIEIKSEAETYAPLTDRTLALLETYLGPVALESFDPQIVLRCRERGTHRPIGLVGPSERDEPVDPDVLDACDFISWSIDRIAEMAQSHPTLPRSTWTVRTREQERCAARNDAQIVFERFIPSPSVNRGAPK